jgi:hypothetical protein
VELYINIYASARVCLNKLLLFKEKFLARFCSFSLDHFRERFVPLAFALASRTTVLRSVAGDEEWLVGFLLTIIGFWVVS